MQTIATLLTWEAKLEPRAKAVLNHGDDR